MLYHSLDCYRQDVGMDLITDPLRRVFYYLQFDQRGLNRGSEACPRSGRHIRQISARIRTVFAGKLRSCRESAWLFEQPFHQLRRQVMWPVEQVQRVAAIGIDLRLELGDCR